MARRRQLDQSLVRFKRVSDLFVDGTEVVLQEDPLVMVWVHKLNSFEDEEARRDGLAYRSLMLLQIERQGEDHSEISQFMMEYEAADHEGKAELLANLYSQEDLVLAIDDTDAEERWQDRGEMLRRRETLEELLEEDEKKTLLEEMQEYFNEIQEAMKRRTKERQNEFRAYDESRLRKEFRKKAAEAVTLNYFIQERDITMIYYALRDCEATRRGDHSNCSHKRLLDDREQVRDLPEELITKIKDAMDNVEVNPREAGNSDAPQPSSGLSEQPSEEEESKDSSPKVMSVASLPRR